MNVDGRGRIHYGTERMRQKLFVVEFAVLVNTKFPFAAAGLVTCGIQLGGARLEERSKAYFPPALPTKDKRILPPPKNWPVI
jgi:hypothetical protein